MRRREDDPLPTPTPRPRPTPTPTPTRTPLYFDGLELPEYPGIGNPFRNYGFSQKDIDYIANTTYELVYWARYLPSGEEYRALRIEEATRYSQLVEDRVLEVVGNPTAAQRFVEELVWYQGVISSLGSPNRTPTRR
jgi:hypothetical protein